MVKEYPPVILAPIPRPKPTPRPPAGPPWLIDPEARTPGPSTPVADPEAERTPLHPALLPILPSPVTEAPRPMPHPTPMYTETWDLVSDILPEAPTTPFPPLTVTVTLPYFCIQLRMPKPRGSLNVLRNTIGACTSSLRIIV